MDDLLADLPGTISVFLKRPDLHTPETFDALLKIARSRFKPTDLRAAKAVAELALMVGDRAGVDECRRVDGLLLVGDIARVSAQWPTAEAAYVLARHLAGSAADGPELHIKADLWTAQLRRDLRQFPKAEALASSALKRARRISALYWTRLALDVLGSIRVAASPDSPASIPLLEASYRMQGVGGSHFDRCAAVNLAYCLIRSRADLDRAARLIREAESIVGDLDVGLSVHISWLRGLLCSLRSRYIPAREFLEDASKRLIELDRPAYAGAALMDLAVLHLEHGRADRAAAISSDLWQLFGRLRIDREAFAAVRVFTAAAGEQALTVELVREVKRALELAQPNIPPAHAR